MLIRLPDMVETNSRLTIRETTPETRAFSVAISEKLKDAPPSQFRTTAAGNATLEEKLFTNRAALKILTSQISMHLQPAQREDLFRQLDALLALDAWAEDASLIKSSSFTTFLRFLTFKQQVIRPALTVSSTGSIMASWVGPDRRLTIEFQPRDTVRLVAHRKPAANEDMESLAYVGSLRRLDAMLNTFDAVGWYRETA